MIIIRCVCSVCFLDFVAVFISLPFILFVTGHSKTNETVTLYGAIKILILKSLQIQSCFKRTGGGGGGGGLPPSLLRNVTFFQPWVAFGDGCPHFERSK